MILLLSFLLLPVITFAEDFHYSFGARAGFLTNSRDNNSGSVQNGQNITVTAGDGQRYIFGPTFEVGIRDHFAIEFSPTFRREGATFYSNAFSTVIPGLPVGGVALLSQFNRFTTSTWDLPVLGKYYFGKREARIRPFLGVGVSAARHNRSAETYSQLQTDGGERRAQAFRNQSVNWGIGPVAGAGVSIRSGRFSIVPEFRYLRDGKQGYPGVRDRAEIFLGFRF
ncbi:MAG: outer membrane beta-barrel protein [Acidobacteria bacterium]|nr:outer membrane beta-barrel protein [Acidobacteriota bacterium]